MTPTRPLRPADVLGVPLLPPPAATVATNRIRDRARRLLRAMDPPPVRILEDLFGLLGHRVLVALCEAGVPEALDRPQRVAELAGRTGSDPERLERLLRWAATVGWVRIDRRGRVRPTRATAFLRHDHPGGWRAWVDFAGGPEVVAAVQALTATGDADPFEAANGRPFFEWMAEHPDRWATFDAAMAAGARMHALTMAAALDWEPDERICDVGGGTGVLLAGLLDLVPGTTGAVLDLPGVVARAVAHPRLEAVGGDMFAAVPAGFDTYLLVNVIHDWGDADATRILERCAAAAGAAGRVVAVDSERPAKPEAGLATGADVLMAALTPGGQERDADGFRALGERAGLRLERSVRLASGDLAHVLRRR
jgi:hypothetical protein